MKGISGTNLLNIVSLEVSLTVPLVKICWNNVDILFICILINILKGSDLGLGLQNWEVSEAQARDREAEQEAREEEGGGGGDGVPGQKQEEEVGAGRGEAEKHQQGYDLGQDEINVCDR